MALLIENITAETDQQHTIIADNAEIGLRLRFHPVTECWTMDVSFNTEIIYGLQISSGTLHMRGENLPFDFACQILDGSGVDPFRADDFASGRCQLYYVTRAEMLTVRGAEVPT